MKSPVRFLWWGVEGDAVLPRTDLRLLASLSPFAKPQWPLFALGLALLPVATGLGLLQPYFTKRAVDAAVVHASVAGVVDACLWYLLFSGLEFVARFGQVVSLQWAGQQTLLHLRAHLFDRILRWPARRLDSTPVGRLVTRVTNDVDSLSELFASGAITAVADMLSVVGIIAFIVWLNATLSLVVIATLPVLLVVVLIFRRVARRVLRDVKRHISTLNTVADEQVNGLRLIQSLDRSERLRHEYGLVNRAHMVANLSYIRYDALLYSVVEAVASVTAGLIVWMAAAMLSSAGVNTPEVAAQQVGTIIALYEYTQRLYTPIRDLANKYGILQSSLAAAERLAEVLEGSTEPRTGASPEQIHGSPPVAVSDMASSAHAVTFREVNFSYRESTPPVLSDLSLHIPSGSTCALVGPTGSGKTTVLSLICGLYPVTVGEVKVLGTALSQWDLGHLRSRVFTLPQGTHLMEGTVAENVAMGWFQEQPAESRVRQAFESLGLGPWLHSLSDGVHTRVQPQGENFSMGERQFIAMARVVYRDPEILLMDEATASIDTEAEATIQGALAHIFADRTVLTVAHRLSTVRRADRIFVLERGSLVEEGTHDALMGAAGHYAAMQSEYLK